MKVVVLGAKGMLGQDLLAAAARAGLVVQGYDLPEVDLARDLSGLELLEPCDWVVNCAAYTDVDGAESDEALAFSVNRDGAARVAEWCAVSGAGLLHISTDYVFDGAKDRPYREDDPANPLGVYGRSKLAGEQSVRALCARHIIVRTQSLFGIHGRNFVSAIAGKLRENPERVPVVSDQRSCPTYTVHLAEAILRLLKLGKTGIVHVSASGSCSWYELACAVADRLKPDVSVVPVPTSEYPRAARRPAYSVLDKSQYAAWTGVQMPSWLQGMEAYLAEDRRRQASNGSNGEAQ